MLDLCKNDDKLQDFNEFVNSFMEKLVTKPKNLGEDNRIVFCEVVKNRYNFEFEDEKADWCMKNVSRELVYQFFEKEILENKRVLVSQVLGKDMSVDFDLVGTKFGGSVSEDAKVILDVIKSTKDGIEETGVFYGASLPSKENLKIIGLSK